MVKKILIKKILRFLFYTTYDYLRYYNLVSSKNSISSSVNFENSASNNYFKKNLLKSKFYLEYGSGGTTYFANKLKKEFLSVESDKNFYKYLDKNLKKNCLLVDFGPVHKFSIPILFNIRKHKLKKKSLAYAENVLKILEKKKITPDFVLIDGRYRVLCGLILNKFYFNKKINNFKIIIDDYSSRKHYHILNKFYFIKKVGRFGVCRKLKKESTENYINKYLLDCR